MSSSELSDEVCALRARLSRLEAERGAEWDDHSGQVRQLEEQLRAAVAAKEAVAAEAARQLDELREQNGRLLGQLDAHKRKEADAFEQCRRLRHDVRSNSVANAGAAHVELLQFEISILKSSNAELERRMLLLTNERDQQTTEIEQLRQELLDSQRQCCQQSYENARLTRQVDASASAWKHRSGSMWPSDRSGAVRSTSVLGEVLRSQSGDWSTSAEDDGAESGIGDAEPLLDFVDAAAQKTAAVARALRALHQLANQLAASLQLTTTGDSTHSMPFTVGDMDELVDYAQIVLDAFNTLNCRVSSSALKRLCASIKQTDDNQDKVDTELLTAKHQACLLKIQVDHLEEKLAICRRDLEQQQPTDEAAAEARRQRDALLERLHAGDVQRSRIEFDNEKLSKQLLRAVEQKFTLQEQLEAWQLDVERLVEQSVRSQQHRANSLAGCGDGAGKQPISARNANGQPTQSKSFWRMIWSK